MNRCISNDASFQNGFGPVITRVEGLSPRLASWDHRSHPSQVRLREYRSILRDQAGELPLKDNLYLRLVIDVRTPINLIKHHDVENYLTPLFHESCFNQQQFPLVVGLKQVGGGSFLEIGQIEKRQLDNHETDWKCFAVDAGSGAGEKKWKQRIYDALKATGVAPIEACEAIEMRIEIRCSSRRNWVNLWKPAGDALSPILGQAGSNPFNPNDDRIIKLTLARETDDSLGHGVQLHYAWRNA